MGDVLENPERRGEEEKDGCVTIVIVMFIISEC